MKKVMRVFLFLFLFLSVLRYPHANAAIPHLINYQGRLTDASGNPLTGSYQITFRIYDAQTAGTLLWEETYSGVLITKGLFNVLLGSVTALNLPFDKPYFLEIKAGAEVMTPRQQIASSGYALRAEDSDKLGGKPPTDFMPTSDITSTPTANKGVKLDSNAKLPSGQDILGNVISVQQANGTTDASISSTSFVDMPDMSLSAIVEADDTVMIDFSCIWEYTGQNGGWVEFQLLRDAVVLQKARGNSPRWDYPTTTSMQYVDIPSSGTHIYKVQWLSLGGGPNTCKATTDYHHRNLRIIKIKT